jgi:hypothetical protein
MSTYSKTRSKVDEHRRDAGRHAHLAAVEIDSHAWPTIRVAQEMATIRPMLSYLMRSADTGEAVPTAWSPLRLHLVDALMSPMTFEEANALVTVVTWVQRAALAAALWEDAARHEAVR